MSSLLREHARRRARTGQLMIAMMQLSAEIALRRFIAASALLGSLSIGTGALAQEIKLTRSAASGIESLLVDERSWNAQCKPLATSVTITSEPNNGKVTIVPGMSIVAVGMPQPGNARYCAGKSITGNRIMYRSIPGFRGTDTLAYTVRYANGKSGSTSVTIDVH